MYAARIFSFSNPLATLDLELLVVHHELLCTSLFVRIFQNRAHARTFDVKFKTYSLVYTKTVDSVFRAL